MAELHRGRGLILIADDHKVIRDVFSTVLQRAGYSTVCVSSGADVWPAIQEYDPDGVILDHRMPGTTGAQLALEIRAAQRWAELPILIATGDLIPEAVTADNDPFTTFVAKPVGREQLLDAVESFSATRPSASDESDYVAQPAEARPESQYTPSFEIVLRDAQNGVSGAFEQIWETLSARVLTFVSSRGAADPHDTLNEIFLRVFTGLQGFDGNEPQFNAWLFTIARNRLIDEARHRNRRFLEVSDGLTFESEATAADVVERSALDSGLEPILPYLELLTDEQHEVVVLRIVAGLSVADVARILSRQPGAVKALQRRGLERIARSLESDQSSARR